MGTQNFRNIDLYDPVFKLPKHPILTELGLEPWLPQSPELREKVVVILHTSRSGREES